MTKTTIKKATSAGYSFTTKRIANRKFRRMGKRIAHGSWD